MLLRIHATEYTSDTVEADQGGSASRQEAHWREREQVTQEKEDLVRPYTRTHLLNISAVEQDLTHLRDLRMHVYSVHLKSASPCAA